MAREISQLSPKAQKVYADNPDLAAKRAEQTKPPVAPSSSDAAASTSTSDSSGAIPGTKGTAFQMSWPDLSVPGDNMLEKSLIVFGILLLGLGLWSRATGKAFTFGLGGLGVPTGQVASGTTQSYIDQQNRRLALISDTMPGRIIRTNPAKVGA